MVLSTKIGKERNFALVLLLVVVTFGIYGIYWHYKAHTEVYKQFELIHEGRDEGIVWLILGLVLFQPLMWVYQAVFVGNVRYVRERLSMTGNLSPGGFLGLSIPGGLLGGIGGALFFFGLIMAAVEPGMDPETGEAITQEDADDANALGGTLMAIGAPLAIIGWGLQILAFGRLQSQLNDVWRGYDQRMSELRPGGSTEAGAAPSFSAPQGWDPVQ